MRTKKNRSEKKASGRLAALFLGAGVLLTSCETAPPPPPLPADYKPTSGPYGAAPSQAPRPSILPGGGMMGGPGMPGFPPPEQPIPAGAFTLTLEPSHEVTGQTLVPVHVISTSSRAEWESKRVSDYWLAPRGNAKMIKFGKGSGGKQSAQTVAVPSKKGEEFVVIIADLPGRFPDSGGSRDPRMEIIELEMDKSDPENPKGGSLTVGIEKTRITRR